MIIAVNVAARREADLLFCILEQNRKRCGRTRSPRPTFLIGKNARGDRSSWGLSEVLIVS